MASELTFTVRADDKGAIAILDATGKAIARIGEQSDEASRKANQSGSAFSGLGAKIIELKNSLDLMGMAMHAAHTAMDALFAGISRGGELADMSQRLGVSVELLSSFELGARTAGLSLGDLGTGFRFLSKSMEDAKSGGDEAAEAFKRVGISAADLQNLNTEELMLKIAEAFSHVENGSAKTALAMQLFGRSGAQLIPFLNEGEEGLRKFQEMSAKLGLTLSTETAQSMDTIGDSIDIMKGALQGAQQQIANGMAPALERLARQAVEAVQELGIADGTLTSLGGTIGEFIANQGEKLIDLFTRLADAAKRGEFAQQLGIELQKVGPIVEPMARDLGVKIGGWIAEGVKAAFRIDWSAIFAAAAAAAPKGGDPFTEWAANKKKEMEDALKLDVSPLATGVDRVSTALGRMTAAEVATAAATASANTQFSSSYQVLGQAADGSYILGNSLISTTESLKKLPPAASAGADAAAKLGSQLKGSAETIRQIELALSGQKSLTQAFQDAEKATIAFAAAAEKGGDATAQLTLYQQELIIKAAESAKAMDEENRAQQEYLRVFNERIAAGDQLSVAQEAAAVASERYALNLSLEQVAHEGVRQAVQQEFEMKQRLAQEIKADAAVAAVQQETTQLNAQIAILQQVIDHTKTRKEAEREIAIYLEEQKLIASGVKENVHQLAVEAVDIRDKFKEVSSEVQKMGDGAIHVSDMIKDAFDQTLDGIIAGTLDMGEIWKSFGISFGKQLFDNIWNEKLNFDEGFKLNILDLVGFVGDAFSGGSIDMTKLFKGASGGGGGASWLTNALGLGGGAAGGWLLSALGGGIGAGGAYGSEGALAGIGTHLLFQGAGQFFMSNMGQDALALLGGETFAGTVGNFFGNEIGTWFGQIGANVFGSSGGSVAGSFGGGMIGSAASGIISAGLGIGASFAGSATRDALGIRDPYGTEGAILQAVGNAIVQIVGNYFGGPILGFILQYINEILGPLTGELFGLAQPPTKGTMQRMQGESWFDRLPVFKDLQENYGDITRKFYRTEDAPWLPESRERLGPQSMEEISGFAGIFAQMAFGDLDGGGRVAGITEEWTNILTDFFGRMDAEGKEASEAIKGYLLQAFKEAGVSAEDAMATVNKLAGNMLWSPGGTDTGYFGEEVDNVTNLGEAVRGTAAIFESELPPGVHIAALAMEEMSRDGVKYFDDLDRTGQETLLNLSKDAENFDKTLAYLFQQGFEIDTEEFGNRLKDITASAGFISENIAGIFTAPSVSAGIEAMMEELKGGIQQSIMGAQLEDLFKTTNIAASFEPVFKQLRLLGEDSSLAGDPQFMQDMTAAIAEGRANLQDYIPQLQAMREAAEQIDEALAEAFKPDPIEQFWTTMADQMKENKDALDSFAGTLYEVASTAEMSGKGKGKTAARAAMQQQIDQTTFGQAQAAATLAATKTPQSEQLAALSTEFQYKIAAAMQDGVVTGAEKADLQALKAKMDAAGQGFADSVSANAAVLADLFLPDRIKASIDAAVGALSGAVGTASGSMFDVIKQGGSTTEAVKAFGESFKSSVKDNILQGMQEAMVESVVMEGALAEQMGMLKEVIKGAMVGGIDASEQAVIDQMIQNISTLTDQTLAELQPTLDTMAGTADKLVNGTTDSADKLNDIKTVSDDAATKVDDLSKQATDSLGALSDAIKPDVTDDISKGLDKISVAFGDETTGGVTGAADALKNALGAEGLGATVGDLISQMGTAGLGASLQDAMDKMGATGLGASLQEAMDALASGGTSSMVGAAEEAAGALKDNLAAGLLDAQDGLGIFASLLRSFQLPTWDADKQEWIFRQHGGPVFAGQLAVVGEAGPELMIAHAGGGATIIPLRGIPMMAEGGTLGAAPLSLSMSPLVASANRAADALELLGESSIATADSMDEATTAMIRPHVPGPGEHPDYKPIDENALEPEDLARIDETWRLLTSNLDKAFSNKEFVEQILNNPAMQSNQRLDQLIQQLRLSGANPELLSALREIGAATGGGTTVNDVRWYADLLDEIGSKEFVEFLKDKRTNAELYQESIEQVAPGGGPLPPVDYLEYSEKVQAYMAAHGNIDLRRRPGGPQDIGPLDFKVRPEGSLTQWLDPESITSTVTLSLDQAIKDFAAGGSVEDLYTSITDSVNKSMYDGLVEGMISALLIEDQQAILSAAIADAVSDGFLDTEDVEGLKELATEISTDLADKIKNMGPAFEAIAKAFGIDLENAVTKGMEASANAIGGALRGALNDPFNFDTEALDQALRQNIFQAVAGGLIDAFTQSAIVQGALAPMFTAIQAIFVQIGEGQLSVAEANAAIAEQIALMLDVLDSEAFKEAMQQIIDSVAEIRDGIGIVDTNIQQSADDFYNAGQQFEDVADAADDACAGECELQTKLARTALGVSQASERAVEFGLEEIVPTYVRRNRPPGLAEGGIVFRNGLFELAEGNRPEVVTPLDRLSSLTNQSSGAEVSELRREVSELVKAFSNVRIVNQLDSRVLTDSTVGQMERRMRGGRRNFRRPPR